MKKKRISAFFLTIALLSGSLSSTAYAATWYMEDGDVIVSASESGQTVSQNNNTIGDNDPTFTNRDSSVASDSTITIKTSDDATANITIEDINLKHIRQKSRFVLDLHRKRYSFSLGTVMERKNIILIFVKRASADTNRIYRVLNGGQLS